MSNSAAADPAPDHAGQVGPIIAAHRDRPGAMLPILHAIQRQLGWVPGAAVPLIADALNCSRAESCQALGALALEAHARAALGLDYYQTSADGALTLEPVYCLGNCACSPAVRVDDEILGRVDQERFDALIAGLRGAGATA